MKCEKVRIHNISHDAIKLIKVVNFAISNVDEHLNQLKRNISLLESLVFFDAKTTPTLTHRIPDYLVNK